MIKKKIFWGDIHNHNEIGYGKGSLERSFEIAENSLDFYAFTPHTWWADLPSNDEIIKQHHLKGFEKVKNNWSKIREITEKYNKDNEFVTIPAWEWHSLEWGDYCVYMFKVDTPYFYANTLSELKEYVKKVGGFIIPHHIAYKEGWRGLNWREFDEKISPVVEIYSEHGNSLECSSHFGMYSHSMGGSEKSQTALEQLKSKKHFGFIACTDDHYGYPGSYSHGITAVIAEKLDRQSILKAIQKRHTYACTGDRILLDFNINEGIMGDFIEFARFANIDFSVSGRDRLKNVEIYKNGFLFRSYSMIDFANQKTYSNEDKSLIRVELGWDMIASKELTIWDIDITSPENAIDAMSPSFCGGSSSLTEINSLIKMDNNYRIKSFTSRKSRLPVNSLSFILKGESSLAISFFAKNGLNSFKKSILCKKSELVDRDIYMSAFDVFSSPKLKINSLINEYEYSFKSSLVDESMKYGDFYFLKVIQENGQMAWSSPIFVK